MYKYILLFGVFTFLFSNAITAQSDDIKNKSTVTLNVSQQASNITPTATKATSITPYEEKTVMKKTLEVSHQASNVNSTATRLINGNNNEDVSISSKKLNISTKSSNVTTAATKTDSIMKIENM